MFSLPCNPALKDPPFTTAPTVQQSAVPSPLCERISFNIQLNATSHIFAQIEGTEGCSYRIVGAPHAAPTAAHSVGSGTVTHCSCPLCSRILKKSQHDEPKRACSNTNPQAFLSVAQVGSVWGQGHFPVLLSLAMTVCLTILLHGSCTETGQCPPLW